MKKRLRAKRIQPMNNMANHRSVTVKGLICVFLVIAVSGRSISQQKLADTELNKIEENFVKNATARIKGQIFWPGKDLSKTTAQVYKDRSLKEAYTGVTRLIDGQFEIRVEPGNYYLVAFVDLDKSGKFDVGDGMGVFGITDWNDSKQEKQLISIDDYQSINGINIPIVARLQEIEGVNKIVSTTEYEVSYLTKFKDKLEEITSGIQGYITWGDFNPAEKVSVFAYTDLSWRYRAATCQMEEDQTFMLNLKPGKYYLLAIVDRNDSNNFDPGDLAGMYGIQDLPADVYPRPVLVNKADIVQGIEIIITGKQLENGKTVPINQLRRSLANGVEMAKIAGKVIWAGHSLQNSIVQVYKEATMINLVKQVELDLNGEFEILLPAEGYYFLVNVDSDGDGKYSVGDAIGGFGTSDIINMPPSLVKLKEGENIPIEIVISATYSNDGQLEPVHMLEWVTPTIESKSGIGGQVFWSNQEFKIGIISLSQDEDFTQPVAYPVSFKKDGKYRIYVPPGDYYVMAIVDLNNSQHTDLRDGVGIYGTHRPIQGNPHIISVFPNYITPSIDITISAIYIDQLGNIAEIDDGHRHTIQMQYGKPDDTFQFTRSGIQIEEWWYWSQGIGFIFEETDKGWRLQDQQEFDPEPDDAAVDTIAFEQKETASYINALIFYNYDNLVWGYAPDGTNEPLGVGKKPTVSMEGKILYTDSNNNIVINDQGTIDILLSRKELAKDPAISSDGNYVAFVRRGPDRQRLYVRHISTGSEFVIPSTAIEVSTPSWNTTDDILTYSARGTIENPQMRNDRNIYTYNRVKNRIDPICVGLTDDADPRWSPTNYNVLAFSRQEENHRQIWLAELNQKGKIQETQITDHGGEKPVWLPNGQQILYENNGQLWLISINGEENHPVMANGQVIFGENPYVVPPPMIEQHMSN